MSVNTQHPEYAKHYPKWVMMRDALNDEVIKKGTVYLSKTPGMLALDREVQTLSKMSIVDIRTALNTRYGYLTRCAQ